MPRKSATSKGPSTYVRFQNTLKRPLIVTINMVLTVPPPGTNVLLPGLHWVDGKGSGAVRVTRRIHLAVFILLVLAPGSVLRSAAQSDDTSLGDLARSLRKTQAPPRTVIDNDNLSDVMEAGVSRKWDLAGVRFSVDKNAIDIVNASSPDVTCALAYNGRPDAPKPENLPPDELVKIDGPATIIGDVLQVAVQNGTTWELHEITVGLTVLRTAAPNGSQPNGPKLVAASLSTPAPPEKRPDLTILYHLKGKADALSAGLFQDQLKLSPAPDQDWHWSIVQAKGVRITGTSPVSPTVPNSAPGDPIVPSSSPSLAPIAAPATVSTTGKSLN